jgi:hypothetical protein
LNAEADIASGDEVRDAIGAARDSILSRFPSKDRGNRLRPIASGNLANAAGVGQTGTVVLDLGSPAPGCVWGILEVIVTGATDREAPTGAVSALYAGAPARQQSATTIVDSPPLGTLVRPAIALPSVHAFSGEAWWVKDTENLFVIVYSLTTAITVVSAVATVDELNASAVTLDRLG